MDNNLWTKILEFDLDNPISEYGFSTRLANENFWTKDFTQKAIIEYKKFMYLAGTSEFMVSPSEIIDIVWHQHLIFTQSYSDFCNVIGKNIQHIPSTHNKEDFEKFKQAKERTRKFYNNVFKQQPIEFWQYSGMYEALNLEKSNFKIRTFIILGIVAFIILILPFYFLLESVYIQIENPNFIISYISLIIFTILGLEFHNKRFLDSVVRSFGDFAFINNLQPFELIYLKTKRLSNVVHGNVNQLIKQKKIFINKDNSLELNINSHAKNIEEFTTIETLRHLGKVNYPVLLRQLVNKPVFGNVSNSMDAFKKYFTKSKVFGKLFYLNFSVLATVLMFGLIRLSTGLLRDKPATQIFILLFLSTIIAAAFLWRLTRLICTYTVPKFYKNEILPKNKKIDNWEWQYFLFGTAVLSTSFIPMVKNIEKNNNSSSSCGTTCGSSCSSGCGSSCSSCGGCGGD